MKKRILSLFCVLALCLTLLPITALAAQDPVWYIERDWDGSMVTEQTKTIDTYTLMDENTVTWGESTTGGWYVARDNVTINQRVQVQGNVYLILTDGCTLTVNGGIQLEAGNSLTIYGQSEQTGTMGRLIASITEEDASIYDAVIGGNGSDTGGNDGGAVTIHGGFVSATATIFNHNANAGTGNTDGTGDTDGTGGNDDASIGSAYGAAIGGGGGNVDGGDGGTITIYGGVVEAINTVDHEDEDNTAHVGTAYGAAIGGGGGGGKIDDKWYAGIGGDGGTVIIYGGAVEASTRSGAAIGGGCGNDGTGGEGGSITIYGGTVEAESVTGAGMGGGGGTNVGGDGGSITIHGGSVKADSYSSAAIGGGGNRGTMFGFIPTEVAGSGGTITIHGGSVEASSCTGAAIGGGGSRYAYGGDGGTITIHGGTVTAIAVPGTLEEKGNVGCGAAIGGGSGFNAGGDGGTITINGGFVSATVTEEAAPDVDPSQVLQYGAAIGGGFGGIAGSGGTITINGGTVKASSPNGAAIGGSMGSGASSGGDGGSITINDGSVTATSTLGAAIGGGGFGNRMVASENDDSSDDYKDDTISSGGTITINGGVVEARSQYGAGIGGGALDIAWNDDSTVNAGLSTKVTYTGGGGGTITINGGTVSAASNRGAGIGGGSAQAAIGKNVTVSASNEFQRFIVKSGDGGTVTISGGTVSAESAEGAAIGSGGMPVYQSSSPDIDSYFTYSGGDIGTFATGSDGSAVLFATGSGAGNHIQDDDDPSGWSGVIFLDGEGQLYGTSVTLSEDVTIPSGNTLEIGQGQILSVDRGVTMTIDNEDCLTGGGTLGHSGGTYGILNPLPVFTPTTLVYTGSDLSDRLSLTAPAGSVSIMGQTFTVSGTPTYRDWVITPPAGGILQVGTYIVTAYSASQGRTVSGRITVIGDSSSTPTYSVILPSKVEGGTVTANKRYAEEGETFRFTVIPDEGYELASLSATDSKGRELDLEYKGDGKYAFKMPARQVEIQVSFRKIPPEPLPFTDVPEGAWYADAAAYVYKHGLMAGTSATTFAPDMTTSRAMIATILWRMAGSPVASSALPFTDVADGTWYTESVRWASVVGVVGGYSDSTFGPDDAVTREQLATMLYRYAQFRGYDVSVGEDTNILSYSDAQNVSEWAIPAMQWACGAGIINGSGSQLNPQGDATRAEIAVMLMRFEQRYNP